MAQIIWVNCRHFLPAINDVLSYTFCIRVAPVEDVFEVVHKRQPVLSVGVFCDRASACAFAYKIIVGSSVLQNCFKRWNNWYSSLPGLCFRLSFGENWLIILEVPGICDDDGIIGYVFPFEGQCLAWAHSGVEHQHRPCSSDAYEPIIRNQLALPFLQGPVASTSGVLPLHIFTRVDGYEVVLSRRFEDVLRVIAQLRNKGFGITRRFRTMKRLQRRFRIRRVLRAHPARRQACRWTSLPGL